MKSLVYFCEEWKKWSIRADKSEDGWQSAFPEWIDLMNIAQQYMIKNSLSELDLKGIEFCWSISEETEDLAEYAEINIDKCWKVLGLLKDSGDKDVRWQVYSVFGKAGIKAERFLREGLKDPNAYCRRRALLSLAKHRPKDAEDLGEKFMNDSDPYIRQASIEMILVSKNEEFKNKAKAILLKDNAKHVAKAAKKL